MIILNAIRTAVAATGLNTYAAVAALWFASMLITSGYVGYKAYTWGQSVEIVKCEVRVAELKSQIDKANAAVKQATERWTTAYRTIEQQREADVRAFEAQEAELQQKVRDYEAQIASDPNNSCKPLSADDVRRLRE